jgi:hypothetical protein
MDGRDERRQIDKTDITEHLAERMREKNQLACPLGAEGPTTGR